VDLVELRARLRALARDPEEMGRRCGLTPETVRQLLDGNIRPSPEMRDTLRQGLTREEP
jgi:transcriptional regulator with XRE-family HTH domain